MTDLKAKVMEVLKGMDDGTLVSIWNEYCDAENYNDDEIFTMDMFDEFYSGKDPLEIAQRVYFGSDESGASSSFNPNRDYFYFDGYANPVSIDYVSYIDALDKWSDSPICPDDLAEYIAENGEAFGNDDLQEVIDEAEEDEESEEE